jgi:cell division transport system permease protein
MSLWQALNYFTSEAFKNLVRGWRISSLAVATTALSLFIGGTLILLGSNMTRAVESWRSDAQIVVYLDDGISAAERTALSAELRAMAWVESVVEVGPEQARERLRVRFPDLSEVMDELDRLPLPVSLEIKASGDRGAITRWTAKVIERPGVTAVDNDTEWLKSMNAAASVASVLGLLIGGILMVGAAISIASVVRLSTFVYRKEIAAMRLIGATEFFVRGPFVMEGIMQGLAGSGMALATLWLGYWALGQLALPWFVRDALLGSFLTVTQMLALLVLGGIAGLAGGVMPLREKSGVFG